MTILAWIVVVLIGFISISILPIAFGGEPAEKWWHPFAGVAFILILFGIFFGVGFAFLWAISVIMRG